MFNYFFLGSIALFCFVCYALHDPGTCAGSLEQLQTAGMLEPSLHFLGHLNFHYFLIGILLSRSSSLCLTYSLELVPYFNFVSPPHPFPVNIIIGYFKFNLFLPAYILFYFGDNTFTYNFISAFKLMKILIKVKLRWGLKSNTSNEHYFVGSEVQVTMGN